MPKKLKECQYIRHYADLFGYGVAMQPMEGRDFTIYTVESSTSPTGELAFAYDLAKLMKNPALRRDLSYQISHSKAAAEFEG